MPTADVRRWLGTSAAIAAGATTLAVAQVTPLSPTMPAPTTMPAAPPPTTRATTAPVDPYERLLGSENDEAERPLLPIGRPTIDRSTGNAAIAPDAPVLPTAREGTFLVDRIGRLVKGPGGVGLEFNFLADGAAMRDPPVKVLPNQKLAVMEDELQAAGRDLTFRISGTLTEYRGRNYVLLEKVLVVRDPS